MTEAQRPPDGGIHDYFLLVGSFIGIISSIYCLYFIVKKLKINHIIKKLLMVACVEQFLGYVIVFCSVVLFIFEIKNKVTCFTAISSFGVTFMGKQLVITMISIIRFLHFFITFSIVALQHIGGNQKYHNHGIYVSTLGSLISVWSLIIMWGGEFNQK